MRSVLFPFFVLLLLCAVHQPLAAQSARAGPMTFEELDGSVSTLAEYLRQGPVYLTFWALWCEPCKQEIRALQGIVRKHADKPFTVLAVNQDAPKSMARVRAYVKSQGYTFPVILDPNAQIFQAFNGQEMPFSVLIDRDGRVVSWRTGYLPGDDREIEEAILTLLR